MLSVGTHIAANPALEESFAKARGWMSMCHHNHNKTCGSTQAEALLPTRVIDVGSSTQDPRLHESTPTEHGCYAALSYCWGKLGSFTTTLSTLNARKAGFKLDDLPKTCRDAIVVARHLRIKYVWIDSLCIIQDSVSDWTAEAEKMCTVYSNATITFAGLDSPDSHTGLFVADQDRGTIVLPVCPSGSTYDRLSHVYVRKMEDDYKSGFLHTAYTRSYSVPSGGILNSRGWTFQEAILSRRILYFSDWEMGWCCRSSTACECDYEFRADWLSRMKNYGQVPIPMSAVEMASKEKKLYVWQRVVADFTSRKLSFQSDRLPAIAGLAKAMHGMIGGRYITGMWEDGMVQMLMWYDSNKYGHLGYDGYRQLDEAGIEGYAPSWSWASVPGVAQFQISEDCSRYKQLCRIVAVEFSPSTMNTYGPGSGTLKLEGHLLPVTSYPCQPQNFTVPHFSVRDCLEKTMGADDLYYCPDIRPRPTVEDTCIEEGVYAVVIGSDGGIVKWGRSTTVHIALVLRKSAEGKFSRIGIMTKQVSDNKVKKWLRDLMEKASLEAISIV